MNTTHLFIRSIHNSSIWNVLHPQLSHQETQISNNVDNILKKVAYHSKSEAGKQELERLNYLLEECKKEWVPQDSQGDSLNEHEEIPLTIRHIINWFLIALFPNHLIDAFPTNEEEILIARCKELYEFFSLYKTTQSNVSLNEQSDVLKRKLYTLSVLYHEWQTNSIKDKLSILEDMYLEYQDTIQQMILKNIPLDDPMLKQFIHLRDILVKSMERFHKTPKTAVEKHVDFPTETYAHILKIYRKGYWDIIRDKIRREEHEEVFNRLKGDILHSLSEYSDTFIQELHTLEYSSHPDSVYQLADIAITLCQQIDIYDTISQETYGHLNNTFRDNYLGYLKVIEFCLDAFETYKKKEELD